MNKHGAIMTSKDCQIIFRIRYKLDDQKQFLAILGNDPRFGNWKESQALVSRYVTRDEWEISVVCPKGSVLEWKWVVMEDGMRVVRWEDGDNRTTMVSHSGVMNCLWNERDVGEVLKLQDDQLQLKTEYHCTESGQSLRLVGSSPELGVWEPERGIQAVQTRPESGVWVVHVGVDRTQTVEYKWVVVDSDMKALRWEERDNRVLSPDENRRKLVALWNQDCQEDESAGNVELQKEEIAHQTKIAGAVPQSQKGPRKHVLQTTAGYFCRAAGVVYDVIPLPFRLTTGTITLIGQSFSRHFRTSARDGRDIR